MIRTVAHVTATLVAGAAIALAGAAPASAAPATPVAASATTTQTFTLTPTRITGFSWVSGQPQWAQPSLDRLARSAFQVQGDRFVMLQPEGYPTLVGTIDQNGAFRATYSFTTGYTGSTTAEVMGQLIVDDGVVTMRLTYVAGSTIAAVVNGTSYGNSRVKAFHATMELRTA